MEPPTGLTPWFSKTKGNTYATLLHHPFLFKGKPTQCSRGSKKDFWRRRRRGIRSSQEIPSTHHKLISLTLHYLPFASRFPLPHFTLAVLSALYFLFASFLLAFLCACVLDCLSRWRKIIPNCVTFPIPIIMISLDSDCSS